MKSGAIRGIGPGRIENSVQRRETFLSIRGGFVQLMAAQRDSFRSTGNVYSPIFLRNVGRLIPRILQASP